MRSVSPEKSPLTDPAMGNPIAGHLDVVVYRGDGFVVSHGVDLAKTEISISKTEYPIFNVQVNRGLGHGRKGSPEACGHRASHVIRDE